MQLGRLIAGPGRTLVSALFDFRIQWNEGFQRDWDDRCIDLCLMIHHHGERFPSFAWCEGIFYVEPLMYAVAILFFRFWLLKHHLLFRNLLNSHHSLCKLCIFIRNTPDSHVCCPYKYAFFLVCLLKFTRKGKIKRLCQSLLDVFV